MRNLSSMGGHGQAQVTQNLRNLSCMGGHGRAQVTLWVDMGGLLSLQMVMVWSGCRFEVKCRALLDNQH